MLIEELLTSRRAPTDADIKEILQRLATAPLAKHNVRTTHRLRGAASGASLGREAPADLVHLLKRISEGQWSPSTTLEQYQEDLHAAAQVPSSRLAIYSDWHGALAVAVANTRDCVPDSRIGPRPEALLFVVYSAMSSTILTGYMASSLSVTRLGPDIRWLT
ncbi:MAG: hypothetical protein DCC58_06230 [Chloroflexi bacterium]|nr:MAG: hypothetical protein DCC58_06230 [Chloroflexota bacterium]